jgi:regulator of sigma E protease
LPLGGYVKISGMIDESMDSEQMESEPQPWEFRSKPAWQRLIVMLGGIIVNILLAWLIFTVTYITVGEKYLSTEKVQKNGLAFGEVGQSVGFKNGDKIISVDGVLVNESFKKLSIDVLLGENVEILRDNKKEILTITSESKRKIITAEGKNFTGPRLLKVIIDSVAPKTEASKIKLQKGDIITQVNNKKILFFDELGSELRNHKNDSVDLQIYRNNNVVNLKAKISNEGTLGFIIKGFSDKEVKNSFLVINKMSLLQAIPTAIKESYSQIKYKVKEFKLLLTPSTGAYTQVKSPIGITRILPETWDWEFVWSFMAMFSIGLAFMNILPIPGLDGGHALFTIAEMITGKKLSNKTAGYVQTGGMIFLLSLMALTFGKDIYQLILDKLVN